MEFYEKRLNKLEKIICNIKSNNDNDKLID